MIRWLVIQFAAVTQVAANKTTDKFSRKAVAGKREGRSTQQLLQMPAVRTDRFSITGFATFSTQGTAMKENIKATESNPSDNYGLVGQYTQYTVQSALYATHNTQYHIYCTQYSIHNTQYHIHCTLHTIHNTPYNVLYTLHTIFLSTKHILLLCPIHKFQYKNDCGSVC